MGLNKVNVDVKADFNIYKHQSQKDIKELVCQEVLLKLQNYEKVANGFAKFVDTDDLITILDQKVDESTLKTL